jgi:hypothetical protein
MDAALEGIVTAQKKGGFKAFIRMGNVVHLMMVIPVITFIKGNAKSGDTLVSHFGGKNCIARVPRKQRRSSTLTDTLPGGCPIATTTR